jgi:hypothetical protein
VISEVLLKKLAGTAVVLAALYATPSSQPANLLPATTRQEAAAAVQSLDFEYFKTRVEPIFVKHRVGRARCYLCHSGEGSELTNAPPFLEVLPDGSNSWTDEQSRLNFQHVSKFVIPGDPNSSPLLMYPLAVEAGGGGKALVPRCGRQFESEKDPDWQTIAAWVRGSKTVRFSRE